MDTPAGRCRNPDLFENGLEAGEFYRIMRFPRWLRLNAIITYPIQITAAVHASIPGDTNV